jgi:hypothetical protein
VQDFKDSLMSHATPAGRIYRDVVRVEEAWRGQNGRLYLTLSCKHEQRRKFSQGKPARVRCEKCEDVRSGGGGMQYDTVKMTKHWQVWNEMAGVPVDCSELMTPEEIAEWTR